MVNDRIAAVRRFNRVVTQRIGALHDEYLSRDRSLGLSRLLWEIDPRGTEVRSVRARLGLDSGHMSRQLRLLETAGLITTQGELGDRRVRTVHLTPAGVEEKGALDRASNDLAESILEPLSEAQRERLVVAMSEVERLLLSSQVTIMITDPRDPHARECLRSYFAELHKRFEHGFDPSRSNSATDEEMTLPQGLLLVATLHGRAVGCGALKLDHGARIAEIKRMWTSPDFRGLGLGRRLLESLTSEAETRGMEVMRLETNSALFEARKLYESAGFVEVAAFNAEPYAHHWFERDLRAAESHPRSR